MFSRKPRTPDEPHQESVETPHRADNLLHPRNWPFRLKLGLATVLLVLVPLFLDLLLVVRHADGLADDGQSGALSRETSTTSAIIGNIISTDIQSAQSLAASKNTARIVAQAAKEPAKGTAKAVRTSSPLTPVFGPLQAGAIYVTSTNGKVIASNSTSSPGRAPRQIALAMQAMKANEPVAVLGSSLGANQSALIVAVPILQGARVAGAVVGEFDPSSLYEALDSGSADPSASDILVAADGRIVTNRALPPGPPVPLVGGSSTIATASQPAFAAARSGPPVQLADGSWVAQILQDNARVVLRTPAIAPAEHALDSVWLQIVVLIIAALALLAALWFTVMLSRPISRVARALDLVRSGNYGVRTGIRQHDEIGQIAATVDMLIARTQSLFSDLDNQRAELENGIIQLFTELAEAASGDLTVRPTLSEGSLGAVADSVSILLERFNGTVKRIQSTADAVSDGTSRMAATIALVSQEAQRQAAQLTAGASAITEMAVSAESVSQRTRAATDVASEAVEAVTSGNKAVLFARDAVKRTGETSKKAARQVKSLGESAQLMGNALLLVQHNTEELHLIAGNASIEAARYAENGGVFRTVADSIEQLAQQSSVALRQIQSVVENTQRETSRVVSAIEDVTNEVGTVAKAVNLAGENFDTINHVVQRLADLNIFIASASEQQAGMAADVAEMIGTLNQVSEQTSRNTAASVEDAVRLRALTETLNDSVATLKVS